MTGDEYVISLEWQVENQQRIIRGLENDAKNLRNFACQLCGRYKTAHEGSCGGCKWEKKAC